MQNESLEKRLRDDLTQSGFASELRAAAAFQASNWQISCGGQFFDPIANLSREFDIRAWFWGEWDALRSPDLFVNFEICAEVKKTDKPWVVYDPSPHFVIDRHLAAFVLLKCEKIENSDYLAMQIARQTSSAVNHWFGAGIHESFKKPNAPSRWFPAFQKLARLAQIRLAEVGPPVQSLCPPLVYVAQPLLVLDGPLYGAKLEGGEIVLSQIEEAGIRFEEAVGDKTPRSMHVDVVTLGRLPLYLKRFADAHAIVTSKAVTPRS